MQDKIELTNINSSIDSPALDLHPHPQPLPPEAKKALVTLMRQGVILADDQKVAFEMIVLHQESIRFILAQTFISLILNEKVGIALITAQNSTDEVSHGSEEINKETDEENDSESESETQSSLISKRTLTLFDTLVLLVLRKFYQRREVAGEQKVVIDVDRIDVEMAPFLPLTNNSRLDRRKLNSTLTKLVEKKILSIQRGHGGHEDRYVITPVIRYVVDATFLDHLLEEYTKIAGHQK